MKTGQLISTRVKSLPFIFHYGIIVIDDGETFVLHNTLGKGSIIEPLNSFLLTRYDATYSDTALTSLTANEIIERFSQVCKKGYSLFIYNCDHFVDCMLSQDQRSEQLQKFFVIGIGLWALHSVGNSH